MNITLNGEKREVPDGVTVLGLLQHLTIQPERVAVELNENVVRKNAYATAQVKDGDRVEIVSFMGGGFGNAECGIKSSMTASPGKPVY